MSPGNLFLVLLLALTFIQPTDADQPEPNRAGLVIVQGDSTVTQKCVEFSEDSITGVELLERAGSELVIGVYGGLGYGVCSIDGEGCAAVKDCFCQCRGSPCAYWVYSHRQPDGSWAVSGVGASSWALHTGDVDGWVWGDGSKAPPQVAFGDICPIETEDDAAGGDSAPAATVTSAPLPTPGASETTQASNADDEPALDIVTARPRGQVWSYGAFVLILVALGAGLILAKRHGN
jgi:hypothetical protein